METTQNQKLGAGILTVSIIQLVLNVLGLLGLVFMVVMKDAISEQMALLGQQNVELTTSQMVISLILTLVLVVGIILILMKKAAGVYIYFTCTIINIIYSIIMAGFKFTTIFSLILPILMAIFISSKKELFGFGPKTDEINM